MAVVVRMESKAGGCRLCQKLFSAPSFPLNQLQHLVKDVLHLQLDSGVSGRVCCSCLAQLHHFNQFQKMATESLRQATPTSLFDINSDEEITLANKKESLRHQKRKSMFGGTGNESVNNKKINQESPADLGRCSKDIFESQEEKFSSKSTKSNSSEERFSLVPNFEYVIANLHK